MTPKLSARSSLTSRVRAMVPMLFGAVVILMGVTVYSTASISAYPRVPDGVNPTSATASASAFAEAVGIGALGSTRVTVSSDSVAATWFTLNSLSASEAAGLPIYYWTVNDESSDCSIDVLLDGSVGGFRCPADAVSSISAEALVSWADAHTTTAGAEESDVDSILNGSGSGRTLVWSDAAYGDAVVEYTLARENDTVVMQDSLVPPASEQSAIERSSFIGEAISMIGFVSCLILLVLAVGSLLRSPVGRVSSRLLTVITLVLTALVMCSAANSLTSTTIVPPPGVSESTYIQALFLSNGFAAALLLLTVKICGEAGVSFTPPSGGCVLGRVTCLPRRQVGLGLVTAAVWLAVCSVVYAWTNENGLTSVSLSQPDDFAAASAFPLAAPLLSSLVAAFQEEVLFRWFALRYIASRTRSLALAITVTAVLWALIHAGYRVIPPASRVIELVLLGIILSVLSLRYGVITAIVAHFAIDYITEALPLARIASPPETVILMVLLALPASTCFIRWTRTPIDRLEKIEMTGSSPRPAKADAHRRQLATRLSRSGEPTERRASAITVRAACKVFDDITALHNVSCTMQYGRISCLLGPNGAGKTTLIHVVIGQETLTDGSVELRVQRTSPHHACAIGYVPDASLVYPLLTVREHLRLIEAVYQLSRFDMSNENDLLRRFGLERHANHLASKLSRGLKKRPSRRLSRPCSHGGVGRSEHMTRAVHALLSARWRGVRNRMAALLSHWPGRVGGLVTVIIILRLIHGLACTPASASGTGSMSIATTVLFLLAGQLALTSLRLASGCAAWAWPRWRLVLAGVWIIPAAGCIALILLRLPSQGTDAFLTCAGLFALVDDYVGCAVAICLLFFTISSSAVIRVAPRLVPIWASTSRQIATIIDLAHEADAAAALALTQPSRTRSRSIPRSLAGPKGFLGRQLMEAHRRKIGRALAAQVVCACAQSWLVARFLPSWWFFAFLAIGSFVVPQAVLDGALSEVRYPAFITAGVHDRRRALTACLWSCVLPASRAVLLLLLTSLSAITAGISPRFGLIAVGCAITWASFAACCSSAGALTRLFRSRTRAPRASVAVASLGGPVLLAAGQAAAHLPVSHTTASGVLVLVVQAAVALVLSWALLYIAISAGTDKRHTILSDDTPSALTNDLLADTGTKREERNDVQ